MIGVGFHGKGYKGYMGGVIWVNGYSATKDRQFEGIREDEIKDLH